MIRSLLKRTKFHRAAILLLAMLCTVSTAWGEELAKDKVEYIGEGGEVKTATNVKILTEDYLSNLNNEIGSDGDETWYYVEDEIKLAGYGIDFKGNVNIILGDAANLNVPYIEGPTHATLNIYGTGKLTTEYLESGVINIYGGTISATNEPGILGDNGVTIYGGKITATSISTHQNNNDISLGWLLPNDYINVSNYGGNVTILSGKEFYYNGTETFSSDKNISNDDIKGKKLQPVVASISIDGSNETIYSCLTEEESVINSSDHDVNIKMLTDANFYGSQIVFDNNNSEAESETTHNAKITLDLNGHTLTGKLTIKARDPNGQPILVNYSIISVEKKANVEITDLSEGKGGTFNAIYCIASSGTLSVNNVSFISKNDTKNIISNSGTLSVNNVSFDLDKDSKSCINNSGTLSVSNTKFYCDNADANNVTHGIYTDENSTLNIGSGISFSGLGYGIYTNYNEEQGPWRARAMTRGSESQKEPAKLYINALPVFKNCMYDIYLNRSIMDFSNATAPLALASGQERITFKDYNFAPVIVFTKDYKQAFTNPTTGVITNPNDIFKYFDGEYYGEIYCAFGEAIFSKSAFKLSVVTSDASGAISNLLSYSEASPDNSNSNLIAALNSLENGGTVQLFSDITGATKPYVINKGTAEDPVTLDLNGHTITGDLTVESGCKLMLIDSSNGKGHIKGAISVPVATLEDCLNNWNDYADIIKSTGKTNTVYHNDLTWTLTKTDGEKIDGNFPLKLTIDGSGLMDSYSFDGYPWYSVHSFITEISLPESLNSIGYAAFNECSITSITIPKNVSEFQSAFYNCTKLAKVTITEGIREISSGAFHGCTALKEISLPESINKIGQRAFYKCGLTSITIPSKVSEILDCTFEGCNNLTEVNIPEGVTKIEWAFYGCPALTEISIPSSVKEIGANTFYNCSSLKTVRINSTNISIYYTAFMNCPSLERIILPNTTTLANFVSNEELYYIYGKIFCTEGYCGVSTENEGKNVIWTMMSTEETDEKDIPLPRYALNIRVNPDVSNQTNFNIGEYNFKDTTDDPWNGMRDYISELNIDEGVTSIASDAFNSLKLIKSVILPNSVENIAGNAFSNCSNLKWIVANNVDKYMNSDGWDDEIKAKLREKHYTLFAQNATNQWSTFCSDIAYTKPEGCTVYTVSGVNSEQVQVAEVEGDVIPAYTPVLIKRAEGKLTADIKAEFSNVVENVSTSGTSYNEIDKDSRTDEGTVIASYDGGNVYGNTGAVLNPKNVGWVVNGEYTSTYALYSDKFLMIDADEGIPTHRFIMRVYYGEVGKARSLTIGVGGDTTGMEELKNEKIEELNSEWYDLQGRKLGSKPTKKGLYINNGKKIVIK